MWVFTCLNIIPVISALEIVYEWWNVPFAKGSVGNPLFSKGWHEENVQRKHA